MKDNYLEQMEGISEEELEKVSGGASGSDMVATGLISSDSGTQLNIVAEWKARADKAFQVDVSVLSYSLQVTGMSQAVELNINGAVYFSNSASINYSGTARTMTPLASFLVNNLPGGSYNITVTWHYNGAYNSLPIGDITASGVVAF